MLLFLIPFVIQLSILFLVIIPGKFAVYGSNDDALIASFSVDNSLGTNSDNWIFIQSLLSMPATFLQQIFPSIGVFGFILALTIIISISSIFTLIYFVEIRFNKIVFIIILSVTLSIFFMFSIIAPTYTGAAIYSGTSGFAILFFLIRSKSKNNNDLLVLASLLLSLSYLIRVESFLLTFGFFLVIIIFDILLFRNLNKDIQILKIPGIFLILVFLFNFMLEHINYNDNKWADYIALNDHRHSIQLRTAEYDLENHLTDLNWSEYDYLMFRKFSLADPLKLNENSLQIAVNSTESTRGISALTSANLKNEIIFINYSYSNFHWIFFIILFATATFFVGLRLKNFVFILHTILILFLSFFINFVFAVSYHLPDRLTFNFIYIGLVAILVLAISEFSKLKNEKLSYNIFLLFMTSLLVFTVFQSFPKEFNARAESQKSNIEISALQSRALNQNNKDALYVGTGSRLRYQWQDPYRAYKNLSSNDNLIIIGWHNLSPIWDTQVTDKGIDPNKFHQEFLKNEDLYWIDDVGALEGLQGFYQQYSKNSVVIDDQGFLGTDFYRVYKVTEIK